MARSENAYQCLFFVEAEFQRAVDEVEKYRACIVVIHFHLRPEPTRAEVTCAEYQLNGDVLKIGEELDKATEGDPVVACPYEIPHNPHQAKWTLRNQKTAKTGSFFTV